MRALSLTSLGLALALGLVPTAQAGPTTYAFGLLTRGGAWTPQVTPETTRIQAAHMANIRRLAERGKLVAAGPMGDDGTLRGLFVFKTETLDEARALGDTDPAVRAGRLALELHPWRAPEGIGAGYDLEKSKQEGAKDQMQEHPLVFLRRRPGSPADAATLARVAAEQQAWCDALQAQGKLSIAGPFTDAGELRAVLVFAPGLASDEAKRLVADSPAVRQGLDDAEPHTWWVAKGVLP